MDFTALPIFPERGLAESVITTVWLGVFVVACFNLRFGWTFSGLVVPGYIVPLLLAKPWSAWLICVEGILAYLLILLVCRVCTRYNFACDFFGRDRFFALVLCSVLVRVLLDGMAIPHVSKWLLANWGVELDHENNLQSFGLVIVSLIANQFWKPGLRRGFVPFVVMLAVTYILMRFVLIQLTNFNVGNLEYMYEDISSTALASPKAYIVLVVTAFVASQLNLRYSWDFNGILIPSLLALQWNAPLKIVASFAESFVIYGAALAVLRLPSFRESTIEGARKLLLFFNVSFIYKLILGHIVELVDPTIVASDLYGFGYLLPTLLALKMHQKGTPALVFRVTAQTSFIGAAAAGFLGFGLTYMPRPLPDLPSASYAGWEQREDARPLGELLQEEKVKLYQWRLRGEHREPTQAEREAFFLGLKMLRQYLHQSDRELLETARAHLAKANFSLVRVHGELLYIREREPALGWGIFVLNTRYPDGMVVEVPTPVGEWATLESGAYLFEKFRASALGIAGRPRDSSGSSDRSALTDRRSTLQIFHRVFAQRDVVQVRGISEATAQVLLAREEGTSIDTVDPAAVPSSLWVQRSLPESLRLGTLKEIVKRLQVFWVAPPFRNVQREEAWAGFCELYLTRADRKRLLARQLLGKNDAPSKWGIERLEGRVEKELLQERERLARRGENVYLRPKQEDLLFLDIEVLSPLMELLQASDDAAEIVEEHAAELQAIRAAVSLFGYECVVVRASESDQFVLLRERTDLATRRYWGTYAFRLGVSRPFAIQVPHPLVEAHTVEFGVRLFGGLRAMCLSLPGAHPRCNTDGSANVLRRVNKRSVFNLINQVILRDTGEDATMVVQVRGFDDATAAADAFLSFHDGRVTESQLSFLGTGVFDLLKRDGLRVEFVDGRAVTANYEAYRSGQASYLSHTPDKEFCALWLSRDVRLGYQQYTASATQERQMKALSIPTVVDDLHTHLAGHGFMNLPRSALRNLEEAFRVFQTSRDVNVLVALLRQLPQYSLTRVVDKSTQRAFLTVSSNGLLLPFVVSLSPRADSARPMQAEFPPSREVVRGFVDSGAACLQGGGTDED